MQTVEKITKRTPQDLTNQRFGRLVVRSYLGGEGDKWECVCDCGNSTIVRTSNFAKKVRPTRSCGCLQREIASQNMRDRSGLPRKDLTGQRVGKLLVVQFAGIDPTTSEQRIHRLMWDCVCDCGTTTRVRGYALTRTVRPVRSCGCLQAAATARNAATRCRKRPISKAQSPKSKAQSPKPKAQSPKPKAVELKVQLPKSNDIVLTLEQEILIRAEYNRIIALVDSDAPFWIDIDIYPKWRADYTSFRDYVEDELPPTGAKLTRISRYGGFEPKNLRWAQ